eukprot:232859-Hanusia_phi.AAC.2
MFQVPSFQISNVNLRFEKVRPVGSLRDHRVGLPVHPEPLAACDAPANRYEGPGPGRPRPRALGSDHHDRT